MQSCAHTTAKYSRRTHIAISGGVQPQVVPQVSVYSRSDHNCLRNRHLIMHNSSNLGLLSFPRRPGIASIFQGRGVAASATTLGSSQLKADTHCTLSRTTSTQPSGMHFQGGSPGVKKSSVCLQTKFQVVCIYMYTIWCPV